MKKKINPIIGLFGTCGGSKWRDSFMERYRQRSIQYYNPQVDDGSWTPDMAVEEAEHLLNDDIILFPVTNETYGMGSLSETGFSIMNAIRQSTSRAVVIMVDNSVAEELQADPKLQRESIRARALVNAHLRKLKLPNVYIVDNLDDMFECSIHLYDAYSKLYKVNHWCTGAEK